MYRIFLTFILFISAFSLPSFVMGFGGSYTDFVGRLDFEKPIGVSTLAITQNITVFKGKGPVEACPSNPNYGPSKEQKPMPKYGGVCYRDCQDLPPQVIPPVYDGSGNLVEEGYTLYSRIGCTHRAPGYEVVLGGRHFAPGYGPEFDKNAECGDDTVPDLGLIVTMSNSKGYMWDPVPPVCVRGGYSSANPGNKSILTQTGYVEDLTGMLATLKSETLDDTLRYMDREKEVYTGIWTNRDIEATGYCADGESGCENQDPKQSGPLNHQQISFRVDPFYDNVKNESTLEGRICDSTVKSLHPKEIKRMCTFRIDTNYLDKQLAITPCTNADDIAYLKRLRLVIFSLEGDTFRDAILMLREIAQRMGKDKHYLYEILGCTYTVEYESEKVRGPYIDKILPTVSIIGSGQLYPIKKDGEIVMEVGPDQVLLDDEANHTQTGIYYAGTHTFTIHLQDNPTSLWNGSLTRVPGGPSVTQTGNVDNPRWTSSDPNVQSISKSWSGVSGIDEYMIELDRMTDEFGKLLETDTRMNASGQTIVTPKVENILYTGGEMNLRQDGLHPRTGPFDREIPIILDDKSGIQNAGLYRWVVYTRDVAGNATVQYAYFWIKSTPIPENPHDPDPNVTDPGGELDGSGKIFPGITINHLYTDVVDKKNRSGSGSDGLTQPGGENVEPINSGMTIPGGKKSNELKGNNIADGLVRDLAFNFVDQYQNCFFPDTSIGRTVDLTLMIENSVYMNQFDRSAGSSVEVGMMKNDTNDMEWKFIPIGTNTETSFINVQPNEEGKYIFHIRLYTPTGGGYIVSDGQVSDIFARLKIKEVRGHVTDTIPPPGVDPKPFEYNTQKRIMLDLFFRPLYVSYFSGDLMKGGFMEGMVQKSTIGVNKNGMRLDSDITDHTLRATFSGTNSTKFSFFTHTTDKKAEKFELKPFLKMIEEKIAPFPSRAHELYSRLIQVGSQSVDFISSLYFSTHIAYTVDTHSVLYNSAVIGKNSFHGAEQPLGYQSQINVFGNTVGRNQSLLTGEVNSPIGKSSFSRATNTVRKTVAEYIRNLPEGKNKIPNVHYTKKSISLSEDMDYMRISGKKTLIVSGGDVFIDRDMYYVDSGSLLGIIVLADEKGIGGNIYICIKSTHCEHFL